MEYLVGAGLALAVAAFAARGGFYRERSFAPTILIVVASYCVLFAVIDGSTRTLVSECVIAVGFWLVAVLGVGNKRWLIPAAIVGHGVFDIFHDSFIHNSGMPGWWLGFCLTFDVIFGGWLVLVLVRTPRPSVIGNSLHNH